jgi:hypothetical protein
MSSSEKFTSSESKYDPSLDAYTDVILFPKKVEMATEHFKKYALPHLKKQTKKTKKKSLSPLQNELLTVYSFDPTEQQMQELKAFLQQLFADKMNEGKEKQVAEIAA